MTKPKYRRLTYDDRRVIENMCKAKKTQSEIANAIGVSQPYPANYLAIDSKAFTRMVERRSKYLCATYLSWKDAKATKNGVIKLLRGMNVKTITFDNGKEFAYHEDISKKLRSEIYFAHPYTSYERGLNEYTNRLLRQYFPKGMDLRKATERELKFALNEINSRPRKTLNWKSPSDYHRELNGAAP